MFVRACKRVCIMRTCLRARVRPRVSLSCFVLSFAAGLIRLHDVWFADALLNATAAEAAAGADALFVVTNTMFAVALVLLLALLAGAALVGVVRIYLRSRLLLVIMMVMIVMLLLLLMMMMMLGRELRVAGCYFRESLRR